MPALLLQFLQANWKLIALSVIILGGIVYHKGAVKLAEHRGYQQATAEWEVKEQGWKKEVARWDAQVAQLNKELDEIKLAKKEVIQRNFNMFQESKKKVVNQRKETSDAIPRLLSFSDRVIVPVVVVKLYNDAVEGTGTTNRSEGQIGQAASPKGASDQITAFEAVAFADVIISNVLQYNELAVRCDALIDIVNELEDVENGIDTKGLSGSTGDAGRDGTVGTVATQESGLGG